MRVHYFHESENPNHYALAALGVDGPVWADLSDRFGRWRTALRVRHRLPLAREPRARDLLAGGSGWRPFANPARRLTLEQGALAFLDGLRAIEDASRSLGGIRAASVCLPKRYGQDCRRSALVTLLEQLHAPAARDGRHDCLIFDQGWKGLATRVCDQVAAPDPVPHRHRAPGDGAAVYTDCAAPFVGAPHFRKYGEDRLLLAANLVAHARLLQEEEPTPEALSLGLYRSYDVLDHAVGGRVWPRQTVDGGLT